MNCQSVQVIQELDSQLDSDDSVYKFLSGVFEFVASTPDIQSSLESSVSERYVEVMCGLGHPPAQIVHFLRATSGYRLAEMLDIVRRYSISDAVVCLLEKSGDIRGAFDIVFERVSHCAIQTDGSEVQLEALVEDIVGLLQRGCRQLEQTELESIWFMLLDFLMDAMKLVKNVDASDEVAERLKSVTRLVINAMMTHVPLPAVLQRIIANEGGVAGHFGDVRDLLSGVLDACSYERTLLGTCARLVNQDLHCAIASLTRASRRGTAPLTDSCLMCGRVVVGASVVATSRHSTQDLICFHCGHLVHRTCLLTCAVTSPASRDPGGAERRWKCPLCSRSSSVRPPPPVRESPATTSPVHSTSTSQLDAVQADSVDRLRTVSRTSSRLTMLAELAQVEHTRASSAGGHPRSKGSHQSSILHNEQFALRLAAPPPPY